MEQEPINRRIQPPRRHFPWLFLSILVVAALLIISIVIYKIDDAQRHAPVTTPVAKSTLSEGDTITIAAAGDINISQEILDSVKRPGYIYDFSDMFMSVAPLLSDADITVADLEVNMIEDIYNGENCNAPESLLTALAGAGVDILQTANTVSVFNGMSGLTSTVYAVQNAGMTPVGTFPTQDAFTKSGGYTLVEAKGFRIAFVAFTKGVGNLNLPEGSENCVNLLYKDYATTYQTVDTAGIQAVLDNVAAAQPDITVALLHWGSEYDDSVSSTQKKIRNLLLDNGVDVILGTHSHMVGEVDTTTKDGTVVAYSLGNLLSSSAHGYNQGIVLKVTFAVKNGQIVLASTDYEPIYIADAEETQSGRMEVLNTNSVISLYESEYITKVSKSIYETLLTSRDKVAALVAPEKD